MNLRKAPALVLALALQTLPLCRVACVDSAAAPTGFAIVMRWLAGAVALLGSYHAVSGASAAIAGVAPYSATNGVQTGPVSLSATGAVGKAFVYRIVVTNPGSDHAQDFWNAWPLPPGLTINTNIGGNGYITGTPTVGGVTFPVTLLAGNQNCSCFVLKSNVTITISGGGTTSPPQITGPPTDQTVTAGANATFSVTATGTAPLSYAWSFKGTPIAGATTSTLQLANVQTANGGLYSVTVTNAAGSASASANLTVQAAAVAPAITAQPHSLTVSNSAAAAFSVTATGTAPLNYLWRKNGSSLAGATSSTFNLASAGTNDSGNYSVVVTNTAGSVTSLVATLTVLLPPSIVTPPQSLTVSNGIDAIFTVVAAGSAPLSYQWKFNGNDLAGATTATLAITGAQASNQGDYTVLVSNAVAAVMSPAAHLTVQSAPAGPFEMGNWQTGPGIFSFDVSAPAPTNVVIWSSSDLAHWTAVKTNANTTGTVHFSETNATGSVEFYRATLSP
jgi:hypothetical protein